MSIDAVAPQLYDRPLAVGCTAIGTSNYDTVFGSISKTLSPQQQLHAALQLSNSPLSQKYANLEGRCAGLICTQVKQMQGARDAGTDTRVRRL